MSVTNEQRSEAAELVKSCMELFDNRDMIVVALAVTGIAACFITSFPGLTEEQAYEGVDKLRNDLRSMVSKKFETSGPVRH